MASRLVCAPIWSSPGPFPGGRAHLSVKTDSNSRVSGRLSGRRVGWCVIPLSGPSQSLLIGLAGTLSVPSSLSGPPVVRQLMQVVIFVSGQGGWF